MRFIVQNRWELFDGLDASLDLDKSEIPPFEFYATNFRKEGHQQAGSLAGAAPC